MMSISKVQNVDIEWAFDIKVIDIECYARYRMSDTRYRGGKDPDDSRRSGPACPAAAAASANWELLSRLRNGIIYLGDLGNLGIT